MAEALATPAAPRIAPADRASARPLSERPPRRTRYGIAACLAWITAAAALVNLGTIHRHHTSDSLVPVLESIYRWQPYYWEQNRYGMLVALLASPVRNPFYNLLVQNAVTIWLGLMACPLAVRYLRGATCRPGSPAIAASWRDGVLAAGTFALFAPQQFQFVYLTTDNIFGTSLALGLAALILLEKTTSTRIAGALVLLALAAWCNTSIGAMLLFLVAGLMPLQKLLGGKPTTADGRRKRRRRVAIQAAFCLAAVVAGLEVFGRIPPAHYRNTLLNVPNLDQWPGLVAKLLGELWAKNDPLHAWLALVAACGAVVVVAAWRGVAGAARAAKMFALTTVVMCAYALVLGIMVEGRWRYGVPAMVLIHTAAVASLTARLPPLARRAAEVVPLVLLLAAAWQHGLPSPANVRNELQTKLEVGYRTVVDAGCTHVAGDYWRVWPAVFAADWRLYEQGSNQTVWGLAHRGMPTEEFWRSIPKEKVRAATFAGDPEAEKYLHLLADHWSEIERSDPLVIHVVRP